jgi:hypothetical protein
MNSALVCLLLYHVPCNPVYPVPVTGGVVDRLAYVVAQPPPPPPWWPLWTVA